MNTLTIRFGKGHRQSLDLRFARTLLCCLALSMGAGCARNDSWIPTAEARERLRQIWEGALPEQLQVLGHRQSPGTSETWIIFSPWQLPPPSSGKIRRSEYPAASLVNLLHSRGISLAEIGTFEEKKGVMLEWDAPSTTFRVRTLSSTKGWVSCIEHFSAEK